MESTYYDNEMLARTLLIELIPILYNFKKYDIQHYVSHPSENIIYDGFISLFNKETASLMANHMIEIKVRDKHYDKLILEKIKYNNLCKSAKMSGADIIYINTTPMGTYVWNLSKMSDKIEWVKEEHNKSTVELYKGKTTKVITHLDIKDARFFEITVRDLEQKKKEKLKQIEEVNIKKEKEKCLYQWLLTPNELKGDKNK